MYISKEYYGCFKGLAKRVCKPRIIVIHHTATATPAKTRSALQAKNYSTHFEIDVDGTIYQYADVNNVCVHSGSVNWQAIGIDLTHKTDAIFTKAQIESLQQLCKYLCEHYNIPYTIHETLEGIYPHNAIGQTACPQNAVKELMKIL